MRSGVGVCGAAAGSAAGRSGGDGQVAVVTVTSFFVGAAGCVSRHPVGVVVVPVWLWS